jgi:BirA family transcriptional regulator, biotin operon repressor / biotin---[acetyl-CoA-carboxylase] ligase
MVSAMSDPQWGVRWFDEIDSTNTYLRDQARSGAAEGLVAAADFQTAGRGRLDRRWESPRGANLLASVLLRPSCDADDLHLCTGAVAMAAADACDSVSGAEVALKWPNDLLVGDRKLAGVLAEAEFTGRRLDAVVVGVGVNVAWPGPDEARGACLDQLPGVAAPVDRRLLLDRLLESLTTRRGLLDDRAGRRALADEIRSRCATIGIEVKVVLAHDEVLGRATAIDDDGRLVVETATGPVHVTTGDVVHLLPAPGAGPP